MNWLILSKMLGYLSLILGGSMTLSLPWAFAGVSQTSRFETRGFVGLTISILICVVLGLVLLWIGRRNKGNVLHKEALAIVGLGWFLAGGLGGLPFLLSGVERSPGVLMNPVDAFFESVSGFTTTGASVITDLENPQTLPRCVLFWRCFTHWLGGMGIVVLFVAILSNLGSSGKAIMQREVTGPINEAVRPRIRETASALWKIYTTLTIVLTLLFVIEGMSVYEALCHSFGTMATGGFSTNNRSAGGFDSVVIEMTMVLFMVLAGCNFSLFYMIYRRKRQAKAQAWYQRLLPLWNDIEFRTYLMIIVAATLLLVVNLYWTGIYTNPLEGLRHSLFMVVTIMTTTGFGTADFNQWSEFAKGLLLLLMFIGGCAGSTAGGLKVIRFVLFFKIMRLEVERSYLPNIVRTLRLGSQPVDNSLRHDVIVYFSLILFLFISGWMTLAAIEPDTQWLGRDGHHSAEKLLDCASAIAATLNNIGPGLGVLGPASTFAGFSIQGKLLLTIMMLLGRLELFAILVLFFPSFWED